MAAHRDPTHNNKDLPKENTAGEVHQPSPGASSTISRLKMLLAHDRTPPAEQVAEIMVRYPKEHQHEVVAWLHQHFGNAFVHDVMTTGMAKAKKAYGHDESFTTENPKANHATGGSSGTSDDPNRMRQGGVDATLIAPTDIYRGDGSVFNKHQVLADSNSPAAATTDASAAVHADGSKPLRIETGAVKKLPIKQPDGTTKNEDCVLCFYVGDAPVTGWVPVSVIDPKFAPLLKVDRKIAGHLDAEGDKDLDADKHKKKGQHKNFGAARQVAPKLAPNPQWRTQANQTNQTANFADHYYERPGGVVNLLANVPASHGGRFGVPIDVLVAGTEFTEDKSVAREHCPLWMSGADSVQTSEQIVFAYGKIDTPGGPKYGWINVACLA